MLYILTCRVNEPVMKSYREFGRVSVLIQSLYEIMIAVRENNEMLFIVDRTVTGKHYRISKRNNILASLISVTIIHFLQRALPCVFPLMHSLKIKFYQ